MSQKGISKTAFGAAYMRAAHLLIDSEPWILEDYIAQKIIGEAGKQKIISSKEIYQQSHYLYLRSHVVLRSRFAEDRLQRSIMRGISQFIILGAGLDSFAYRQPSWAEKIKILEVDSNETQKTKIKLLSTNKIDIPNNISFVPINFETESLKEGLRKSKFDFSIPTFVSWLGVTMYLSLDVIKAVFETIHLFPKDSEIVFTYANTLNSKSIFEDRSAELGKKWESNFSDEEITKLLVEMNFSDIYILNADEIEKLYFNNRVDNLPIPKVNSIISATV